MNDMRNEYQGQPSETWEDPADRERYQEMVIDREELEQEIEDLKEK